MQAEGNRGREKLLICIFLPGASKQWFFDPIISWFKPTTLPCIKRVDLKLNLELFSLESDHEDKLPELSEKLESLRWIKHNNDQGDVTECNKAGDDDQRTGSH